MISGSDMGYTSHQVKRIYRDIKSKGSDAINKKCDMMGCRGGFRENHITGEVETCPKCQGYGFLRSK